MNIIKQTDSKDYGRTSYIFTAVATPIIYINKAWFNIVVIILMFVTDVIHKCLLHKIWNDKLHFQPPHLSDYGRTCYISPHATSTPHLITEGQVTFPLLLPYPPDYVRTSCTSPSATTPLPPDFGRTSYISPPATTPL